MGGLVWNFKKEKRKKKKENYRRKIEAASGVGAEGGDAVR